MKVICSWMMASLCLASFVAQADIHAFPPVPWRETCVTRSDAAVFVKDRAGRVLLQIVTEGGAHFIRDVDVKIAGDALELDASKALAAGSGKVVMKTCTFDVPELAGRDADLEMSWRRPSDDVWCAAVQMFLLGTRTDGSRFLERVLNKRVTSVAKNQSFQVRGRRVPDGARNCLFRFDIMSPGAVRLVGGRIGLHGKIPAEPISRPQPAEKAKLLFRANFDNTPEATVSRGAANPMRANAITYEKGVCGQAARFSSAKRSELRYAVEGNANPRRGSVSFWFRTESGDPGFLFSTGRRFDETRHGSGALFLWFLEKRLRADAGDDDDRYVEGMAPSFGDWHHVVLNWDVVRGHAVFLDGLRVSNKSDAYSPVRSMYHPFTYGNLGSPGSFDCLVVGGCEGRKGFDGLIDEFRVYSAPLTDDEVALLYREMPSAHPKPVDYPSLTAIRPDAYVASPRPVAGQPGRRELVLEMRLDSLKPCERFKSVGSCRLGVADGTSYLEAGTNENDRFAIVLDLDPDEPFYWLEIDYPDDKRRTMDIVVQEASRPRHDYTMGVGVMCGGEYPSSGRIRTHRCLVWTREARTAVVFMTARAGSPAAVSAVRLYRDVAKALPRASVTEPSPVAGRTRTIGMYFEDASVNYDFAVSAATPEGQVEVARRLAAKMLFTGENLFAHPGVFYHGVLDESYMPRPFARDYLSAFYGVFDKVGLGVMPTINTDTFPGTEQEISLESIADGSVHRSIFSVSADAAFPEHHSYSPGPIYNIAHPDVQRRIESYVDRLVKQGVGHPSFKGVALHLRYGSVGWFGTLENGYNDYCIEAFERETGIRVPVSRTDPLRGKAYATWLRTNAREEWIRWRCRVVTDFWLRMARKLAAARPDLSLWINQVTNLDADTRNGIFLRDDYMVRTTREGGFDAARFNREAPNGRFAVTHVPADYRWLHSGERDFTPEMLEHLRKMNRCPGFWDLLDGSAYPMAHTHDRYWECSCGRGLFARTGTPGPSLSCKWFVEHPWRVGTINPAGRYALEQYAVPLRHGDRLGITKGGWMVDTYGMEDVLAPFAQAFRALPAKVMTDVPGTAKGNVRVRECRHDGRRYVYAVNTDDRPATAVFAATRELTDLVTGEKIAPGDMAVELDAYELRSFVE